MPTHTLLSRARRRFQVHVTEPLDHRVRAPLRRLRNAGRSFRPVFIGGASGSGTSFVSLSLGQRFQCASIIYETNLQVSDDSFLFVPPIDTFESVRAYQRYITPLDSWSVEDARRALLDLYRGYASGPGDVALDKGPDINLVRAAFLDRCFPDGRFLMIFRDPVANVEGLRRKWKTFGDDPLEETIRFYRETHEAFLDAAASFADRVVAVEYEALVERPDALMAEIGRRLGLAPATRAVRFRDVANAEGKGIRNVRRGRVEVVRDASQRALDRIGPVDAERIRAELDPLRERLRAAPFTL